MRACIAGCMHAFSDVCPLARQYATVRGCHKEDRDTMYNQAQPTEIRFTVDIEFWRR